jgi:thiamine-phosphate pyrophosphorylase
VLLTDLGAMSASRRDRLQQACLYLVCDAREDAFLHAALTGGVDLVQLRMKSATDDQILAAATRYRAICDEHGALLILNDRPDLAAAANADGVHVGQDDVAISAAREAVGTERILGLSTHTPGQIEEAGTRDVDYIGVGPVHATPTKPGRPAVGTELVAYAAERATTPFFAIGGIDAATIGAVLAAGATRVAVVRAIAGVADPERAARELRTAIQRARSGAGVGST